MSIKMKYPVKMMDILWIRLFVIMVQWQLGITMNVALPTPTRENYTFLGWYTDPIEGDKISGDTVVTKDTTYYAHWQYNEN